MIEDRLSGEVVGFRQWYVNDSLHLRSAHISSQAWKPDENVAVCKPRTKYDTQGNEVPTRTPCEHSPGHDCECGLYALHSPGDLWYGRKDVVTFKVFAGSDPLVAGVVSAWGKLEVHHQGFRSEFARIVALAEPEKPRDKVVVREVAKLYAVPVVAAEQLEQIACEYGQTVPEAMRPEKPEATAPFSSLLSKQFYQHFIGKQATIPLYQPGSSQFHYTTYSIDVGAGVKSEERPKSPKERAAYRWVDFTPKHKGGRA